MEFKQFKTIVFLAFVLLFANKVFSIEKRNLIVDDGEVGFKLIPSSISNVDFKNLISLSASSVYQTLLNGSGVCAGDYDGDGLVDLYFAGIENNNKLYRNLGNFKFKDVTSDLLKCEGFKCTATGFIDINGDAKMDLVVGTISKGLLVFINQNNGQFEELKLDEEIPDNCAIYGVSVTDLNQDGDLDMYISTYRSNSFRYQMFGMDRKNIKFSFKFENGKRVISGAKHNLTGKEYDSDRFYINSTGRILESGVPDYFIINENGNRLILKESSQVLGVEYFKNIPRKNWGLGSIFADINNDYLDDLYVCNDLEESDYFIVSDGTRFRDGSMLVKKNSPMFSMGIDVADINNDQKSDVFICDMLNNNLSERRKQMHRYPYLQLNQKKPFISYQNNRNMLFIGNEYAEFDEIAYYSGIESSDWSWVPIFMDVDLDGYQDLIVTNGFAFDIENIDIFKLLNDWVASNGATPFKLTEENFDKRLVRNEANYVFKNNRDLTFTDKAKDWGFLFKGITHGACLADLDNDGDEDLILNNFSLYSNRESNSEDVTYYSDPIARIYENKTSKPRIRVGLDLDTKNNKGIGAIVTYKQGDVIQTKQIRAGSRYCSSDQPAVTFSYDRKFKINELNVYLNGLRATLKNIKGNVYYELEDKDFKNYVRKKKNNTEELFEEVVGGAIAHDPLNTPNLIDRSFANKDIYFNEPVMAIYDAEWNTLPNILYNAENSIEYSESKKSKSGEQLGRLYDFFTLKHNNKYYIYELRNILSDGGVFYCYINLSTYDPNTEKYKILEGVQINGFYKCFNWKPSNAKRDKIDIILGGGPILNQYPNGYDTLLIGYDFGENKFNMTNSRILERRKIVNDLHIISNDAGRTFNIFLACEFAKIKVYEEKDNKFVNITNQYLDLPEIGLWNSITSGDLNGDGIKDYILGNASENSRLKKYLKKDYCLLYDSSLREPVYYEAFRKNDEFELNYNLEEFKLVNPSLADNYKNNEEFLKATANEVFGKKLTRRQLDTTRTIILLSQNAKSYKIQESYRAELNCNSIYGAAITDFNLDGKMDIYLSQGFPANENEDESSYNSAGLFMIQDKSRGYNVLPGESLGVSRDIFSARNFLIHDINDDNKPDIIIGDYGKIYRTYKNKTNKLAIKLTLIGNDIDLYGVKARLRYKDDTLGPLITYIPRAQYRISSRPVFYFGYEEMPKTIELQYREEKKLIRIIGNKYNYSYQINK